MVHGQIILNQFKNFPKKTVANSAFVSGLKGKLELRRHCKLYAVPRPKAHVRVRFLPCPSSTSHIRLLLGLLLLAPPRETEKVTQERAHCSMALWCRYYLGIVCSSLRMFTCIADLAWQHAGSQMGCAAQEHQEG